MDGLVEILKNYGLAGCGLFIFGFVIVKLAFYIRDAFKTTVTESKARETQCRAEVTALNLKVDNLTAGVIERQHLCQMETNRILRESNSALDRNTEVIKGLGSGKFPIIPPLGGS